MKDEGCGTFTECTNCASITSCCACFDQINAPSLNKEELETIKNIVQNSDFYDAIDGNLFTLKTKDNKCIFYVNDKCLIYDNRPTDCKLYPFDIMKIEQKYYLVLCILHCINYEQFQSNNYNIDSLINDIVPWIDEFTDERNFSKIKKKAYKTIKEIKL